MPNGDKIKVLYDAVSKDYNIGTYDEFNQKLSDPAKRKAFYDGVGKEYQLGSFDEFEDKIGFKKKSGTPASSPSASTSSSAMLQSYQQSQDWRNKTFNTKPVSESTQPVSETPKQTANVIASKDKEAVKKAKERQVINAIGKPSPEGDVVSSEFLQNKYGSEWQTKATKQELENYARYQFKYYNKLKNEGVPMVEQLIKDKGEEAIQKAADDLYNTPIIGSLYYKFIKPISYAGGKGLSNTVSGLVRYGGRLTGTGEITEDIADWVNENINPDNRWKGTLAGTTPVKLQGNLFNNGKINTAKILPSAIETLTTMAWLTGGAKNPSQLMGRSFLMTEQDYRNEGAKYGLKGNALDNFAFTSATLTSALEMISPNDLITGRVKTSFVKEYSKAITEGFSSKVAMTMAAKEFGKDIAKENLQEFSQNMGDKFVRYITDKTSDKPVFNDDLSWNGIKDEIYETVLLTTISTGALSSVNTIRNSNPTNLEKSTWFNVANNEDEFKRVINKGIINGTITNAQAQNAANFLSKYRQAIDQAKAFGFSEDQQAKIAWEIYKGNDISEQKRKLTNNPTLKEVVEPTLKKEDEKVINNIKAYGMGVPDVGEEISGEELSQISENIGSKVRGDINGKQFRLESINLKELFDNKKSFQNYVQEHEYKGEDNGGLLVPAVIDVTGKIIDGRSRLAQQYKNGVETVNVFKELKQPEVYEITGNKVAENENFVPKQKTFTDFDETVWDNKTQSLTPLGEKLKEQIKNGEDVTVLTSRENTPENIKFISEKLGIPEENIKAGLDPKGKADLVDEGSIFYDNNDKNIAAAEGKGAEVVDVNGKQETGQEIRQVVQKEPVKEGWDKDVESKQNEVINAEVSQKYFSKEAFDEAKKDEANGHGVLVLMPIDDFLAVNPIHKEGEKTKNVKELADKGIKYNEIPFLIYSHTPNGTAIISGHEGRHRAVELKNRGEKYMPVLMRNGYQNENMGSDYVTRKSLSDPNAFNEETSGIFPEKLYGAFDGRENTVPFPLTREGKSKVKSTEELLGKPSESKIGDQAPAVSETGNPKAESGVKKIFTQSREMYDAVRNAEGGAKKRTLADARRKFMDENKTVKFIDDNMQTIYKALEEKGLLVKEGDCP